VKPKKEWVATRVLEAKERLTATEAGQLVWKSMEHHGGLEKWWNNGPVYYRFNYQPKPGTGTARDTYELADYWSSRTRHQRVSNLDEEYGWDGKQSWFYPASAEIPYNTRFWALTPYYFAGMPFVFADEGVTLSKEADVDYEKSTHHMVRVTFGENVGDAPDDYYVLYINAETYRLAAIRYVVSYPAYFQNGGHSQEKLMTYDGEQTIEGITFPEKHRTYMWEADGSAGAYVTDITLSDIAFKPNTAVSYFEIPEGGKIMEGLDK
jgi:outer membrane lipoprotein-sorting protein